MVMEKVGLIYEDDYILVLNKPSGMVVNISQTTSPKETLQAYLQVKLAKELAAGANPAREGDGVETDNFYNRAGLVHRLDKETSGIIIVAKDELTFANLQAQFKSRGVEKEYVALVFGKLAEERIEINAPIGRNPRQRTKMAVTEGGKASVTVVKRGEERLVEGQIMTLVHVFPKTGRTHQIRIHLAAMGNPVAGDDLYAGKKRSIFSRKIFGGLMLHAHKISFTHPHTGERVSFEAELPGEFNA